MGENREQAAHDLGPLSGFYIRRHQRVQIELPSFRPAPGVHTVSFELELAGVMDVRAVGSLLVVAT